MPGQRLLTLLLLPTVLWGCTAPERDETSVATPSTSRPASQPTTQPALPFEKEIVAFEQADAARPPSPGGIVFVGSSSIRLWKTLEQDFADLPVINRGFGGSQVADSVRYADRIVLPHRPKTVVLYAGDNDIAGGKSPEQVFSDFKAFVNRIHRALPDTRVLYIAIKPSIARWHLVDKIRESNRLIDDYTRTDARFGYIDTFTPMLGPDGQPRADLLVDDGLHLNADGYALWTSLVRPEVERRFNAEPVEPQRAVD